MGFQIDMAKFQETIEKRLSESMRKVALDLHKNIVLESPVDTGRLKANNQIGIGSRPNSSLLETDKSEEGTPGTTIPREAPKVNDYKPGDDIWICNNVEYAYYVEVGRKGVPPVAMFGRSYLKVLNKWPSIVQEVVSEV